VVEAGTVVEVGVVTGIELPVERDVEPGVPLLLLVLHEPSKTAPMEASPASFRKSRRRTADHAKRLITCRQEPRLDWRMARFSAGSPRLPPPALGLGSDRSPGDHPGEHFQGLRDWMGRNKVHVIAYFSVIVGIWLIGTSTYSLIR